MPDTSRLQPSDRPSPRSQQEIRNAVRLAVRYANRAALSSDPHADPDLEAMRDSLREAASGAQLSDDWWVTAGLASWFVGDNADMQDDATLRARHEY